MGVERRNLGLHLAYTQIGRMREAAGQGTASSDHVTAQVRQIDPECDTKISHLFSTCYGTASETAPGWQCDIMPHNGLSEDKHDGKTCHHSI